MSEICQVSSNMQIGGAIFAEDGPVATMVCCIHHSPTRKAYSRIARGTRCRNILATVSHGTAMEEELPNYAGTAFVPVLSVRTHRPICPGNRAWHARRALDCGFAQGTVALPHFEIDALRPGPKGQGRAAPILEGRRKSANQDWIDGWD